MTAVSCQTGSTYILVEGFHAEKQISIPVVVAMFLEEVTEVLTQDQLHVKLC